MYYHHQRLKIAEVEEPFAFPDIDTNMNCVLSNRDLRNNFAMIAVAVM